MKRFVLVCAGLLLFAATSLAQTMYVSEIVKITLRTGKGTDHKIIDMIPSGQPVVSGYVSSGYGTRKDPFTGKKAHHKGIDFAGKHGSDVIAVAAGLVTKAGKDSGYGNLVEINHGGGYVTRYGHNSKLLVEVGEKVEPGQVIAKMGSTGRSTGAHVHFEVLVDGKPVNPKKFVVARQ